MDILIKNMEMPKSCGVCPIKITNAIKADFSPKNDGSQIAITKLLFTCCILAKDVTQESEKGLVCKDCPLVALPEHGRLGDLDLVEEWMRKKHKENDCPFNIDAFLFALKKFPTIVEASNGTDN